MKYRNFYMRTYCFLVGIMATSPLLAQTEGSYTENFLSNTVIHLAKWAFYGLGGAIVLFGVLVPIAEKQLKKNPDHVNVLPRLGWALAFFMIPSMINYGFDWFNSTSEANGALQEMKLIFQNSGSGGGTSN